MTEGQRVILLADSYEETTGGIICIHKLAEVLQELGFDCYLLQPVRSFSISRSDFLRPLFNVFIDIFRALKPYKRKKGSIVKTIGLTEARKFLSEAIFVCPEITFGNPLGASKVVRWFLHHPGFHTGQLHYAPGEYHIRFNSATKLGYFPHCFRSDLTLPVYDMPTQIYLDSQNKERSGTCYMVRKGTVPEEFSPQSDWICVDGFDHEHINNVMNHCEYFVSYDPYTAYSKFAVLAGCKSVVLDDVERSVEEWYPDEEDRWGIAYGWENLSYALATREKMIEKIRLDEIKVKNDVAAFIGDAIRYFENPVDIERIGLKG